MIFYLAGPMRGHPHLNFPAFKAAREALRANGHTVLCPAEEDERDGFDPDNPGEITKERYEEWMARDFAMIDRADAIALLPGWEESEGAQREVAHAALRHKGIHLVRDLLVPPALGGEVRVTDPTTGGQKGSKLARFDLLPWEPIRQVAEHFGRGAKKYSDNQWRKGYRWSLSFAALHRHLAAWWCGEDNDPEMGSSHLAAAAFHVLALLEFAKTHPEKDDRPCAQTSGAKSGE